MPPSSCFCYRYRHTGRLTHDRKRKKYFVVITDWFLKLIKVFNSEDESHKNFKYLHGTLSSQLRNTVHDTDKNEPQLASKLVSTLRTELGPDTVATTEYHPQVKAQVKRFNATIISRLKKYNT